MKEVRKKAKEMMKGYCRVCPTCDGRACAGEVPGMGGIGTGSAFRNNISALADVTLNMRLLHDVCEADTSVDFLGIPLTMPVIAAPIGGIPFNTGGGIEEHEYVDAILAGCKEVGTIGSTGDGVPEFIYKSAFDGIAKVDGHGIPFIKPWEGDELNEKIEMAAAAKPSIFGMDIDAAGLITLRLMGRPVSPKTANELTKIVEKIHSLGGKFILKGIMDPDEACMAADAGVDALVVSNHGGRVLDHTPGTAEVLPAIAEAVHGKMTIIVDGGIRDGFDVLKVLALGADCAMIGRPFCTAAIGGGKEGVAKYLQSILAQLKQGMVLTGCKDVAAIGQHVIYSY